MTKIILERKKCIGCGSCAAVCSKHWEIGDDGKIHLKDSKANPETGDEELETEEIGCTQEAVDVCPVQCIHIIK